MSRGTMKEVRETPWNGQVAAVLFAGWCGTSIGLRQAGFRVAYANEFNDRAADAYELNSSIKVDRRDVRDVTGAEMLAAAGGTIDHLDASPPCPGFSTARGDAALDDEEAEKERRLYWTAAERAVEIEPRTFVCENVMGLLRDPHRLRYLEGARRMLAAAGYRTGWSVVKGRHLGVPQKRERVILVAVREDVGGSPRDVFNAIRERGTRRPTSVCDVAPHIARVVVVPKPGRAKSYKFREDGRTTFPADGPMPTLMKTGIERTGRDWIRVETKDGDLRHFTVAELAAVSAFPRGYRVPAESATNIKWAWCGFGNSVPPPMARAWGEAVAQVLA